MLTSSCTRLETGKREPPIGLAHTFAGQPYYIFVRCLAVKHPLACPYDGPYRVVRRADKFYTLDIKGKSDTVSIDRLKPAYINAPADEVPGQFMHSSNSESISIEMD